MALDRHEGLFRLPIAYLTDAKGGKAAVRFQKVLCTG